MTELGTVLDGKYEILKKVGQGGMSIVYLAMDNRLNKQWAVKEIKNDGSKSTATLLKGLEREANILKNVDHPVLPRIVDIINENGTIYVIMDFVEGKPLSDVLKEEGAQDQENVIAWGRALASALDYLHSMNPPIIYRDMKPSNVMLKPDGTVKLIDFGTAKEYVVENNADTTALGTRGYAAPEQFGDAQGHGIYNTDARTDIYNLGATLYHLVTGKNPCEPPYEIKPIRQWNPALSSGFEQIINKCCQASPGDRYQSCSELLYALDNYNELDNEFRAKNKKKLAAFVTVSVLSVASIICSVVGAVKKNQLKEMDYNNKITLAEEARIENPESAISYYKQAIALDGKKSDAYMGILDTYAYYYVIDEVNEGAESGAEMGIRYVIKYKDDFNPDVAYEVAMLYYDEVQDYKAALTYFNMVKADKSGDYAEEVEQAGYYAAICENINTNSGFDEKILSDFADYNDSEDNTKTSKYINYLNIANVYVNNLSSGQVTENAINILVTADEEINQNATELNAKLPENKNVAYYSREYNRLLYQIYAEIAEDNGTPKEEKKGYYENGIDALENYFLTMDEDLTDASETDKKAYSTYKIAEAKMYIDLAESTASASYYEDAENVYNAAEKTLGKDQNAGNVYTSHLGYLLDRYQSEYKTTDPTKWGDEGKKKVKQVYTKGMDVEVLSQGNIRDWNSLIRDPMVDYIIKNN